MLKRGCQGAYRKMSPKHLERCVAEFTGRCNLRESDTLDQMTEIVEGMAGKRLRYNRSHCLQRARIGRAVVNEPIGEDRARALTRPGDTGYNPPVFGKEREWLGIVR